jgi:hypothetical protein
MGEKTGFAIIYLSIIHEKWELMRYAKIKKNQLGN